MAIAHLLDGRAVPAEHVDALLELAYLMTAADGRLDGDELDAFREVVAAVQGKAEVGDAELDRLLDRFAGNVEHAEVEERVRALGKALPAELRELAFKVVVGISVVDLATNRQEMAIEDALVEAMGLSPERADALTAEVYGGMPPRA